MFHQNKALFRSMILIFLIAIGSSIGTWGGLTKASSLQREDQERRVWNKQFEKNRPSEQLTKTNSTSNKKKKREPVQSEMASKLSSELLGLTIWRLRRKPLQESMNETSSNLYALVSGPKGIEERVKAATIFNKSDLIRLSIEVPRKGRNYLYVIDREMHDDGKLGAPTLIFPTKRHRNGDNLVRSGNVVDIPGEDENPPYFEFKDTTGKLAGERLTIIVCPNPLPLPQLHDIPLKLDPEMVEDWEKKWSGQAYQLEVSSTLGKQRTIAERRAAEGKRELTQRDPLPQTIYRVKNRPTNNLLVVVPLSLRPTSNNQPQ